MGRPLRPIWSGPSISDGVVEMTDQELRDICAPVILTYVVNNPSTTYGTTVRINTAGTYDVAIGSGNDTRASGALNAHPVSNGTISTYTVYQNERAQTPVPLVRPVHYVVSGDVVQIKEMTNQEIIDNIMPAIAAELTDSGQGSYYIGESAPSSGTWVSYGSFVDTYYDAGGIVTKTYSLWQRTSADAQQNGPDINGAPELRPLKQVVTGNVTQLVEMSNTEIQGLYSYLGEYIRTTGIGKYVFQTSVPGTGTWVSRGSFIDRVNDLVGIAYNGAFSSSFTKSYIGAWTGSYTPSYSQAYTGLDAQYIANYTGVYAMVYTKPYTVAYTLGSGEYPYVSAYYTLNPPANYVATVLYTRADSSQYAGNLSYLSTYTSNFTSDGANYAGQYTGVVPIYYVGTANYGGYVGPAYYTVGTMPQAFVSYYTRTTGYAFPYTSVYSRSYTGLGAPSGSYAGVSYTGPSGPTYIGGYTSNLQYSRSYTPTNPTAYTRSYTGVNRYTATSYTRASGGSYIGFYTNIDNTEAFAGSYTLSAPAGFAAVFTGTAVYNSSSSFTQDATVAFNTYYTGANSTTYGALVYAGLYTNTYTRVITDVAAYTGPATAFALGGFVAPSYTSAYTNQYTGPQQYVGTYTPNIAYNSSYTKTFVTSYTSAYVGSSYIGSYVNYFTGTANYTSSLSAGVAIFDAPYDYNRSSSSYNYAPNYVNGAPQGGMTHEAANVAAQQNIGNTTTWTVPSSVTSAEVYVIGGGGAGGRAFARMADIVFGTTAANSQSSGGGGGGGEMNYQQVTGLTPGSSISITVGAGGNPFPQSTFVSASVYAISGVNASSDYITTITPHGFINGDKLYYYTTNATSGSLLDPGVHQAGTPISNLTDGSYYYVVAANTTSFKLTSGSHTNTTPIDIGPIGGIVDQIHVFKQVKSVFAHGSNSQFGISSDPYFVNAQGGEGGSDAGIDYFTAGGSSIRITGTNLVASNTNNAAVGGDGGRSGWALRYGTYGFGTSPQLFERSYSNTISHPLGGSGGGYSNAASSDTYTQLGNRDFSIINVTVKNGGGNPLVMDRFAHGEPSVPGHYTSPFGAGSYTSVVTGDVKYYTSGDYSTVYTAQTPFSLFYLAGGCGGGGGGSWVYKDGTNLYVYGTIYPQYYYLGIYGEAYVEKYGVGGLLPTWLDTYTQGNALESYGINAAYEPTKIRWSDIDPKNYTQQGMREWSKMFPFGVGNGGGGGYVYTGFKSDRAGTLDAYGGQGSPGAVYVFYSVDGPAYTSQAGYQRSFTGSYNASYTSSWAGYYTGSYTQTYTNTAGYAGFYTGVATYNRTTTAGYAASYSRSYTRDNPIYVSRVYTGAYTTTYAGTPFVGSYAASFTTTYTGSFTGSFTGLTTQPSTTATTYTLWLRTA